MKILPATRTKQSDALTKVSRKCYNAGMFRTPTLPHAVAIFAKEFLRVRNGAIQLIYVLPLCYLAVWAYGVYNGIPIPPEHYLGIAFYISLTIGWLMTASIYAIEHEKNTFPFLRGLPVSPLSIALGKIGFVMAMLGLLIAYNLLCCCACWLLQGQLPGENAFVILLLFFPCIAEMLVWGIFWSTRCRNIGTATAASLACVGGLLIGLLIAVGSSGFMDDGGLTAILPFRLAVMVIVGILACRSALRWFDFSVKEPRKFLPVMGDLTRNFYLARYPLQVQPPFLALIHQHLRHASLIYPLGVFCFILFSSGCLFFSLLFAANLLWWPEHALWLTITGNFLAMGMLVFWGNIFGHDQRNDSYRFLGRVGIHAGMVWWSRMVPAAVLYFPVLPCLLIFLLTAIPQSNFAFAAQLALTAWLAFMALGAFCSISNENQGAGIGGTFALGYLLAAWGMTFTSSFGSSILWTTLPVAFAFLIASRLRAGYWLREIDTKRSRLIPLIPVFATVLVILVALPFVRIYSVPYVSWEQVNTYLADAPPPYKDRLLQHYADQREHARSVFSGRILKGMNRHDRHYASYFALRLMPWEEARRERMLRLEIVAALVESGNLSEESALSQQAELFRDFWWHTSHSGTVFDGVWDTTFLDLIDEIPAVEE